ncbi:MAG: pyridoxamine 5'-phosphate oxidase [Saprospiraceae bacterium]|nr:pyridoxamine 5'-phosphate oxidase [Saprospiraceae bacterium]
MTTKSLKDFREDYGSKQFDINSLDPDPVRQFDRWLKAAIQMPDEVEPNAMTLATVDATGQPMARIVLLKDILDGGFVFFTNYLSHKGEELKNNAKCSLVFWWRLMHRQVRIEGTAEKVDGDYSSHYFHSRPIGSQLGAIVSPQSQVIPDREILDMAISKLENSLAPGQMPDRPEHWGGFRIVPHRMEFWQGHSNRLHDRFQYRKEGNHWIIERLAP